MGGLGGFSAVVTLWGDGSTNFLFTFEAPADPGQFLFEVPVEVGDGRVELYVRFGAPAGTSEYDCRDITPNAYLSCELPSQEARGTC